MNASPDNSALSAPTSTDFSVLVVDDSPVDRAFVSTFLKKRMRATVTTATDGVAALSMIASSPPDIVLTDLQMPEMDGLSLVESIRRDYPFLPTVLMTAHGSEEIALAALRSGAASYVNKRNLAASVEEILRDVLSVSRGNRQLLRLHEYWETTEFEFRIGNDASLIPVLVNHLQQYQASVRPTDATEQVRIGIALHEALRNAIHHGNLEMDSKLRQENPESYYRLEEERRTQEPYRGRRVYLRARESRYASQYMIQDEGPGFDAAQHAYDPSQTSNLLSLSGRGLFLIRTFMDEVSFNPRGNEITMIHRRPTTASAAL